MDTNRYLTTQQQEQILQDVIDLFLIPHFMQLGLDATGEWKENVKPLGNTIWGRDYTEQLVHGRAGGSFPPIAPLKKWAMAKFGASDKEALSIAFAVSNKIAKFGTNIYQKGGTDLIAILKSDKVVRFINEKTGEFIKNQVTGNMTDYIKKIF